MIIIHGHLLSIFAGLYIFFGVTHNLPPLSLPPPPPPPPPYATDVKVYPAIIFCYVYT